MPAYLYIIVLLSAFVIAYISMPLVIKLAHRIGAVDRPDPRKVHSRIMPRLGGMAVFIAFITCTIFITKMSGPMLGLVLGSCIVFLVGVLDDMFQLSAWIKLVGQIIAAAVAMYFGIIVHFVTNPFDGLVSLGMLSLPLTLLWIVGITNAINLIDGLDGLAGGVSAIAASTLAIVSLFRGQTEVSMVAFVLVAAIMGFLPYNFHPAKTFMGDGGSNLLGFVLGCLAILGTTKSAALISLFIPIVILGIPIFDTFFAIIRRINNRSHILRPDKDHLHHRLMALGLSHRRSVFAIYAMSGFFGVIAVTLSFVSGPKATLVLGILLLLVLWGAGKIGMFTGERADQGRPVMEQGKAHNA